MTKIIVDVSELSKYSQNLADDAQEFDSITNRMESIVSSLSGGWTGQDAQNFISNASAYLSNLKTVRDALNSSSSTVAKNVVAYNNRINDFYSKLGG